MHERYDRMRSHGEFPEMPPEPAIPVAVEPPPLTRGGTPQHPSWYRVMAMIRRDGAIYFDFVTETRTEGEAIIACSRYPFRAVVTDWHSKRLSDNFKPIEDVA